MRYADRLAAGNEFTSGEGVSVGIRRPNADVEWVGTVEGPLFERAQLVAEAYRLRVLPGIEFYAESALVKAQCEAMVDELDFLSGIVNDDVLHDELRVLKEAALACARSSAELLLVLAGP